MVIGIYILVALTLFLLSIAFNKGDSTLIFMSGILMFVSGLDILRNGFGDLSNNLNFTFAVISIFIGLYLCIRVGLEMIEDKDKKGGNK